MVIYMQKSAWSLTFFEEVPFINPAIWLAESILAHNPGVFSGKGFAVEYK